MDQRGTLCFRCGAVIPSPLNVTTGEQRRGDCPECGHGFTQVTNTAVRSEQVDDAVITEQRRTMIADMLERSRQAVEACDFTVYGLDGRWTGSRWISGSGGSGGVTDNLKLAHGDPVDEGGPHVRVTTRRPAPWNLNLAVVARSLAQSYWHGGAGHSEAIRSTFRQPENPTALWDDQTLNVDGQPTVWKALGDDRNWVALAVLDDVVVGVHARAIDAREVGFTRVVNFEPYLVKAPLF